MRVRVLGSGSTGNATLVEAGGTRVLIDAGLGARTLAERLQAMGIDPRSIEVVFVSHEHEDHVRGAASFSGKWGTRLAGTRGTRYAAGLGEDDVAGYDVLVPGRPRYFGALEVEAVGVPHDAAEPVAFVVSEGGHSFGHATDFGQLSARLAAAFAECTALLVESNYDDAMLEAGDYPRSLKDRIRGPLGHVSNASVARYLERGLGRRCARVLLAHLSQQNNLPSLALASASDALRRAGREDVVVDACPADGTDWVALAPSPLGAPPSQLRLF
jgi:phosphoribosyl 1,2-cyclic phosphodiesterase